METPFALPYIDEFLTSVLVERSGSIHTQKSYARDLKLFSEFLKASNSRIENFPQNKLMTFCNQKDLSKRSQARVVSALRSYYRFLQRQGLIREMPKLEITEHARPLPEALSNEEVDSLIRVAKESEDNDHRALRNLVVLGILFGTGCRVSELCSINVSDLQLDLRTIKIKGKGGKERLVPMVSKLAQQITDYLKVRIHLTSPIEKSLIVNDRGNRPSRIDIFRWLKKWSTAAGFKKNISPHKLRHTCATQLLREGVDLRSIQALLGHSNIATTEIYTRVDNRDLADTVRNHHPLSSGGSETAN